MSWMSKLNTNGTGGPSEFVMRTLSTDLVNASYPGSIRLHYMEVHKGLDNYYLVHRRSDHSYATTERQNL